MSDPAAVIRIPSQALVVLVGTTGAGKTTFAKRHFASASVLSSDVFRARLNASADDDEAMDVAFDALHFSAAERLSARALAVIDATNVNPDRRLEWVALGRRHRVPAIAIVLDVPPRIARERNARRQDKLITPGVLRNQRSAFTRSLKLIAREGFADVHVLRGPEAIDAARVELEP